MSTSGRCLGIALFVGILDSSNVNNTNFLKIDLLGLKY